MDCDTPRTRPTTHVLALGWSFTVPRISCSTITVLAILAQCASDWEAGKGSCFIQLLMQALKCFKIGQPPMEKTLSIKLWFLSPIFVCSSIYEMHISFFCISKLFPSFLLRLRVAHWNSLTGLMLSTSIHHGIPLYMGTFSFQMAFACMVFFSWLLTTRILL